jgi:hypothetical protein
MMSSAVRHESLTPPAEFERAKILGAIAPSILETTLSKIKSARVATPNTAQEIFPASILSEGGLSF